MRTRTTSGVWYVFFLIWAAGVSLGSQVSAEEKEMESLAKDFSEICIQALPDIDRATAQASGAGFKRLPKGQVPELENSATDNEGWSLLGKAIGAETMVILRLADKALPSEASEVFSAQSASLCEIIAVGPSADPNEFERYLSERLRLGAPDLDIMNSGHREMSWNIFVAYNRSSLMFKNFQSPSSNGFSVDVIVPHQIQ